MKFTPEMHMLLTIVAPMHLISESGRGGASPVPSGLFLQPLPLRAASSQSVDAGQTAKEVEEQTVATAAPSISAEGH